MEMETQHQGIAENCQGKEEAVKPLRKYTNEQSDIEEEVRGFFHQDCEAMGSDH